MSEVVVRKPFLIVVIYLLHGLSDRFAPKIESRKERNAHNTVVIVMKTP